MEAFPEGPPLHCILKKWALDLSHKSLFWYEMLAVFKAGLDTSSLSKEVKDLDEEDNELQIPPQKEMAETT